jgi:hypothetical protein
VIPAGYHGIFSFFLVGPHTGQSPPLLGHYLHFYTFTLEFDLSDCWIIESNFYLVLLYKLSIVKRFVPVWVYLVSTFEHSRLVLVLGPKTDFWLVWGRYLPSFEIDIKLVWAWYYPQVPSTRLVPVQGW